MRGKPVVSIEGDGTDLFVVYNGKRIAKRGHPGTPQAKTWIPLEPGYTVTSNDDHSQIEIEHFGARIH